MNKASLLVILSVIILVVGCVQQRVEQPETVEEEEEIQEEFEQEPAEPVQEEVAKEPAEEEKEELPEEEELVLSEEFKELLDKANSKVDSMRYVYYGPPEQQKAISFVVKDDKMKVTYPKAKKQDDMEYDTVYIDRAAKTAEGYCKDNTCKDKETGVILDYDEHYKETPLEKINQVISAEAAGEENIESQKTIIFQFKNDKGEEGRIWVEAFSALARKIETTKPSETKTEYLEMSTNNVKEEELTP